MGLPDPIIGRKLGDYTILELLGKGGMARVYKGYDEALDRHAAVKVITSDFVASADEVEYKERFQREARAIARLRHPNIVGIYQFGDLEGLYYMAMVFLDGEDLRVRLKQHVERGERMAFSDILRMANEIASALDYAHSQGVIHRDIKPSNIMMTSTGATLTDFGLALSTMEGTAGDTFGSAHYIAPEQAISSARAVPQSDLYSLGVVLYEAFTGKVPFDDPSVMSVALKHLNEPPPRPTATIADFPSDLEEVLLRILAKDPDNRYTNGREFVQALQRALPFEGDTAEITSSNSTPQPSFPKVETGVSASKPSLSNTGRLNKADGKTPAPAAQNADSLLKTNEESKERDRNGLPILWIAVIMIVLLIGAGLIFAFSGDSGGDGDDTTAALEPANQTATAAVAAINGTQTAIALAPVQPEALTPLVTEIASEVPTENTSEVPTEAATELATVITTEASTETPTEAPTEAVGSWIETRATELSTEASIPVVALTERPSEQSTEVPTEQATAQTTENTTEVPTEEPSEVPTELPSQIATELATEAPTALMTETPTETATEDSPTSTATATTTASSTATEEPSPSPRPNDTNTPSATATLDPSPTLRFTPSATIPAEDEPDIELVYSDERLVLTNISGRTLNLSTLSFVGNVQGRLLASSWQTVMSSEVNASMSAFRTGGCIQIVTTVGAYEATSCRWYNVWIPQTSTRLHFWTGENTQFEIYLGLTLVGACDATAGSCLFSLDPLESENIEDATNEAATEAANTPSPTPVELEAPDLSLRYTSDLFLLENVSGRTLDLSTLRFEGESSDVFRASSWSGVLSQVGASLSQFASNGCVQIVLTSSLPLDQPCLRYNVWLPRTSDGLNYFWGESRNNYFDVFYDNQRIARCPIVTGNEERSCDVALDGRVEIETPPSTAPTENATEDAAAFINPSSPAFDWDINLRTMAEETAPTLVAAYSPIADRALVLTYSFSYIDRVDNDGT